MSEVFEQVMAQCARGSFTGLLRVQTREGNGEVRFLSGIQDGVRFDTLAGDAALARLQTASDPEFEVIAALPPIDASSQSPVPIEGGLDRLHAAQLMRYCESNSLTCALELETGGKMLTARYRLGELLSVEPDSELTSQLAEAKQGVYRFKLPRFELPAAARSPRSAAAAAPAAAPVAARPAAPAAGIGTPSSASVTRPAAPNAAAALKPAAAPQVQPMRIAPVHTRPTPAATPAARSGVPASVPTAASARTPAAPAAAAAPAARAATPAAAVARPAVAAEPLRAAPAAEPLRPAPMVTPRSPAAAPAPAAAPSPAPAAAARPAATAAPAEKAPAPREPTPAAAVTAPKPKVAARPAPAGGSEGRTVRAAPAARQRAAAPVSERSGGRSGLLVVMALLALGLVAWVLLGSPLPGP